EVRLKLATRPENIVRLIVRWVARCGAVCACSALACLICMLAISGATAQGTADSQSYPNRTVRIIVPFPPGRPTDTLLPLLAQRLTEVWHHPVLIEHQPAPTPPI